MDLKLDLNCENLDKFFDFFVDNARKIAEKF